MIEIKDVTKAFKTKANDIYAVKNINLNIKRGEIFGIIGHSGAGKSTLIRCVNLLERPTSGSIIIDGHNLVDMKPGALGEQRKKIGMIFQHFNLMPSRSVIQNVMFPLKNTAMSKAEKKAKATELLNLVGLSHRTNAYPSGLSGGEKQRVAIARALANDPVVLLCDEATSALDPKSTKAILNLLKEVNEKLGITIMLITHEMQVIKEVCHRVAVMEGGEVKEFNTVYNLFASPKSPVAKEFVASTNNMHKIHELLGSNSQMLQLAPDETLVQLLYKGNDVRENLLQQLGQRFGVTTNIVSGGIEIIQEQLLGNLVIILKGTQQQKDDALVFLAKYEVGTTIIEAPINPDLVRKE